VSTTCDIRDACAPSDSGVLLMPRRHGWPRAAGLDNLKAEHPM
jgi:hypothetical protein